MRYCFENKLITITPATINIIPIIVGGSGICLNRNIPASDINTIPTPDQLHKQLKRRMPAKLFRSL